MSELVPLIKYTLLFLSGVGTSIRRSPRLDRKKVFCKDRPPGRQGNGCLRTRIEAPAGSQVANSMPMRLSTGPRSLAEPLRAGRGAHQRAEVGRSYNREKGRSQGAYLCQGHVSGRVEQVRERNLPMKAFGIAGPSCLRAAATNRAGTVVWATEHVRRVCPFDAITMTDDPSPVCRHRKMHRMQKMRSGMPHKGHRGPPGFKTGPCDVSLKGQGC